MNKTIKVLAGLLAVQILVGGIVLLNRGRDKNADSQETLLRLGADDFDRVLIKEPGKPPVTLLKKDGKWTLPERWGFPIATEKVALTIDKLLSIRKKWPVGDTADAQKRCKVTEESFEKKVLFSKGEKEKKVLYLGSSPEYRKVHFRPEDRDGVYLEEFGYHDLSINPADWENKRFLALDRNTLMQIETPTLQLVNKEDGFHVNIPKESKMKPEEIEAVVSQVTNLAYGELLGTEMKPEYGLEKSALKLTVRTKDGQTTVYNFGKPKSGDDYYLKSSQFDYIFKIPKSALSSIFPK